MDNDELLAHCFELHDDLTSRYLADNPQATARDVYLYVTGTIDNEGPMHHGAPADRVSFDGPTYEESLVLDKLYDDATQMQTVLREMKVSDTDRQRIARGLKLKQFDGPEYDRCVALDAAVRHRVALMQSVPMSHNKLVQYLADARSVIDRLQGLSTND